jgi:hypothetical protein
MTRNRRWGSLISAMVALVGCGGSEPAGTGGQGGHGGQPVTSCDPSAPTAGCNTFHHSYGTQTIEPGQEVASLCQSWTLDNPEEVWVNAVELHNDGAYHHSNWFFVPNTQFTQPDGAWDCTQAGFDELAAAVSGGVLFAQSTQSKEETQKFPAGVAVRVPPYARVVGSTHLLNTTSGQLTTSLSMTISTIPKADVKVALVPFRLTYHDLHIPPMASAEFTSACDFKAASTSWSLKLYYVLPHYHKLGTSFSLSTLGGPDDGKVLDSVTGFDGEARGKTFDPPIDMSAANGFSFTCGYQNPTTKEVGWGIGDQEMCEMLGFADSALVYDAYVKDGDNMVGATQNGAVMNSGPCTILALPWNPNKPGGVPPKQ